MVQRQSSAALSRDISATTLCEPENDPAAPPSPFYYLRQSISCDTAMPNNFHVQFAATEADGPDVQDSRDQADTTIHKLTQALPRRGLSLADVTRYAKIP